MNPFEIPFELHITVDNFDELKFIDFCISVGAKPLIIELTRGQCRQQPMLSKILHSTDFTLLLKQTKQLVHQLQQLNFTVKRIKIEIPSYHSEFYQKEWSNSNFEPYFEWHCKVNYIYPLKLVELCNKHNAHLSINALKNELNTRFITLREFGNKKTFEQRILNMSFALEQEHWKLLKQQSEYCIYDTNTNLDKGWLIL